MLLGQIFLREVELHHHRHNLPVEFYRKYSIDSSIELPVSLLSLLVDQRSYFDPHRD